ncbi:MAG: hypothetical protein HQK72_15940 [Desulfamplus sp.]|nr:hypothetical protein [Desulfamplus sp.]
MKSNSILLLLSLTTVFFFGTNIVITSAAAETQYECGVSSFDSTYGIDIPCLGFGDKNYRVRLKFNGNSNNVVWNIDAFEESTDCQWSSENCTTFRDNLQLVIPKISIDGKNYTLELLPQLNSELLPSIQFTYINLYPSSSSWYRSDSHGALSSCSVSEKYNGEGKKLLAVYMVGSDLESGFNAAATIDLVEMLDGYSVIGNNTDHIDIVVAFGGSSKDNWKGVRFATIDQLKEDSKDGHFGNLIDYDYKEERAHMGDLSTLKLFFTYLKEKYTGHSTSSIIFWDHGADYNGFGFDENYRMSSLSLEEIKQAFLSVQSRFDLIGFDACLMASMETANFVHESGDYLLASEDLEPSHGWNWKQVVIEHAGNSNTKQMAENIINNYVDNSSYSVNRSGKTLSVVELGQFSAVKQLTSYFIDELIAKLQQNDSETAGKIALAVDHARVYPKTGRPVSVDLQDFAINIIGAFSEELAIVEKGNALISSLNEYILYSKHDGSRPYSYGTTINLPTNAPHDVYMDPSIKLLQTIWKDNSLNDTRSPVVENESDDVPLSDANLFEAGFKQEDILSLKVAIESGLFNQAEIFFLQECYDIITSEKLSFEEKMAAIDELENSGKGVFPRGSLKNIVFSRGVFPRTVSLSGTNSLFKNDEPSVKSGKGKNIPIFMLGERSAFLYRGERTNKKDNASYGSSIYGTVASFADKYLKKVTTIYGTLHADKETGKTSFEMAAEIPAYPTQLPGEYFTPAWNRMWYTLQYDPALPNVWIPLKYETQYYSNGMTYTVYSAEMEYIDSNERYPSLSSDDQTEDICKKSGYINTSSGCANRATLELTIDSKNSVVSHKIITYNKWAQNEDFVLLDKNSKEIKSGDAVRFVFDATGDIEYEGKTTKDFIYFTQSPKFSVELLAFVDPFENGEKKFYKFYYAMRAVDIAGNSTITTPVVAYAQIPDCLKLKHMEDSIANAIATLSSVSGKGIVFNSPSGDDLDEAMATAATVIDTEQARQYSNLKTTVITLFDLLYNYKTYNDKTIWDWSSVDWENVKSELAELLSDAEAIRKELCH